MEQLPAEVIGNILSLGTVRDGVVASTICQKWREAWRNHLHTLSFNSKFDDKYSTGQLEIIITETVLQTTGLRCLSICMEEDGERSYYLPSFSSAKVIAWLMYTRDTLRRLCFNANTSPQINILEKCGKQKLEELVLCDIHIAGVVGLNYHALKSLTLKSVIISPLNLSLLLTNCPKLEALSLIDPEFGLSDTRETVKLASASLKGIFVESLYFHKFVLEADRIEKLHLKDCTLELFELVGSRSFDILVESLNLDKFVLEADGIEKLHVKGCTLELFELLDKGSLRVLHIDDSQVTNFNIDENAGNLEVFGVNKFTASWPRFYQMISGLSKLRELRLWGVEFNDEYNHPFNWESIFVCFPQLSQLSLSGHALYWSSYLPCFPSLGQPSLGDNGSSYLQNVMVLELGWTVTTNLFSDRVSAMLQRCPSLKKLVICGDVSKTCTRYSEVICGDVSRTSIVQIMRKYNHVAAKLEYKYKYV